MMDFSQGRTDLVLSSNIFELIEYMDATTLGITVLGGDTRVSSNGQLIRLEDLASTPGPPGLQGERGNKEFKENRAKMEQMGL